MSDLQNVLCKMKSFKACLENNRLENSANRICREGKKSSGWQAAETAKNKERRSDDLRR